MVCIGRHVGGHALALQHGGQNYFLLMSCSTFHSYAQMCCKRYHIIFSTFSLKFKCKICVQREVIHNFKKTGRKNVRFVLRQVDLATERERQLTKARANQTTGLTNG